MRVGDAVGWQWAGSVATGHVVEIRPERTEITSKGKQIVRNGTTEDPAVIIKADNGSRVVRLAHELQLTKGGDDV